MDDYGEEVPGDNVDVARRAAVGACMYREQVSRDSRFCDFYELICALTRRRPAPPARLTA